MMKKDMEKININIEMSKTLAMTSSRVGGGVPSFRL